jgi:opacity protein-like surface antigen
LIKNDKNIKKMKKGIIYMMLLVAMAGHAMAQAPDSRPAEEKPAKAWELGAGGSVFQFSRTSFSNFSPLEAGYVFDLKLDHAVYGGNLYVARELNDHFYLDLQGTAGAAASKLNGKNKTGWFYMIGPGLQWRLGEYFGSKYIDPYLRVGINYMHKDFEIIYAGTEGLDDEQMKWVLNNLKNKDGLDRKNLMPISLGMGLNMWLNDRWGIGMQGDYLVMPYKNVANSLQGTLRVMYRLGGKGKKVQYADRSTEAEE